jgi:hypothetical protein
MRMEALNITLPESIANALAAYMGDRNLSSPDEAVQTALEEFLLQQGYLAKPKRSLRLTPAPQGSGFTDTSVKYDQILVEQTLIQKLPGL